MAKTALGMPKRTLVQSMGASAAAFGVAGVLAPQALGQAYGVPSSPHTTQLLRLFGSRMLALAAWTFTARTREETERVLAVAAAMNVVDVLIALAAARTTGATAVRAAATSATFAALGLAVRSLGGLSRRLRRRRSGWAR
jgi:predicted phage tail protein